MALKVKSSSSLYNPSWIEPIGNLTDFNDLFQKIQEQSFQSVDWLKMFHPKDDHLVHLLDDNSWLDSSYYTLLTLSELGSSSSSSETVVLYVNKKFDEKRQQEFIRIIRETRFEPGEDNAATLMFADLLHEKYRDEVLKLMNLLFVDNFDDSKLCVKILTMLGDYSYDELKPYSQSIALASIANKNPRVKSAALNMFAHWGNKDALRLLNEVDEPTEPWIKMKYHSIKKSLEKKCSMLER